MKTPLISALFCCTASSLFAGGSIKQVAVHIPNETAPAGGVVQMKLLVTEPTPISSGRPRFEYDQAMFDDVWGIQLFNPSGSVSGVALINNAKVSVNYISSSGPLGSDYPIMTVALHIRPDAAVGSKTQFSLDPSSSWNLGLQGPTTMKPIPPALITVGGSISITNVVPGGGILAAGTVVKVFGIGFSSKTQVQLSNVVASSIVVVSATEIDITLGKTTDMSGKKIHVVNPDGSQDLYYSYLRGIALGTSVQPLLAGAVPVFASTTATQAIFAPIAAGKAMQFTGLAIQNPDREPASVTVSLFSGNQRLMGRQTTLIPSGYRLMRDISELTGGVTPQPGSYLQVESNQPVQMFGFLGDNTASTVTPFAAVFSK